MNVVSVQNQDLITLSRERNNGRRGVCRKPSAGRRSTEMADLVAFLASLRYFEPSGSALGTELDPRVGGAGPRGAITVARGLGFLSLVIIQRNIRMTFTEQFLTEVAEVASRLNRREIDRAVELLAAVRAGEGRLFILGVGGSAANASHAVNDFRKIAGFEAYAPTDNVSELSARTNDEGWASTFAEWLRGSRLGARDGVLVFSVGGGNLEHNVSPNLVSALDYARARGAKIIGIVGRDGGYTARVADSCVLVPVVHADHVTPHSEAFQAVIWHLMVSHPSLKATPTKWESVK